MTPSRNPRGTVFIVSSVHWHFTWQRHHEFASRLAESGFEVVFVEPLPKRWPRLDELSRVWGRLIGRRDLAGGVVQPEPAGVEIVSPRLLPETNALARRVNARLAASLARRLRSSRPHRPRIAINYLPLAASIELQRWLEPDLAIYDCVWDWSRDPHARPAVLREEELISAADVVTTDAPYLFERMMELHPRVRQLLPAVDYARWEPARRPGRGAARPLSVYFGAVGANLDFELLRRLSHATTLRLIGPIQEPLVGFGDDTETIGPVDHQRLPRLIAEADCLVLPYRARGHTRGVIPAKTFECLATGKPTIVHGLPSLRRFERFFVLCDDHDSFLQAVAESAEDAPGAREARLEEARRHDWSVRIGELVEILERELLAAGHYESPSGM